MKKLFYLITPLALALTTATTYAGVVSTATSAGSEVNPLGSAEDVVVGPDIVTSTAEYTASAAKNAVNSAQNDWDTAVSTGDIDSLGDALRNLSLAEAGVSQTTDEDADTTNITEELRGDTESFFDEDVTPVEPSGNLFDGIDIENVTASAEQAATSAAEGTSTSAASNVATTITTEVVDDGLDGLFG